MLGYRGGNDVKCGYYWNAARWEIVTIPGAGGVLRGGPEQRYVRVPIALLLVLAPVMGGLYVLFLPFIGFFMVLRLAERKLADAVRRGLMELMAILLPAWRPGEAYLAGKRAAREGEGEAPPREAEQDQLEDLAREIESKRQARE